MMKDKYKVLIRSCWALLLVCFIIKIFGGNLFEIACENEIFISICNYIDSNTFLRITINCIIALILDSLTLLAIMQTTKYNKLQAFIILPLIIISSICYWYAPIIKTILELIFMIGIPLIYKVNWKRILLGLLLVLIFQQISLFTKNIGGIVLDSNNSLVSFIMYIDVFIMLILYYLYANKRKEKR